jgi:hypothetical protein
MWAEYPAARGGEDPAAQCLPQRVVVDDPRRPGARRGLGRLHGFRHRLLRRLALVGQDQADAVAVDTGRRAGARRGVEAGAHREHDLDVVGEPAAYGAVRVRDSKTLLVSVLSSSTSCRCQWFRRMPETANTTAATSTSAPQISASRAS